MKQTALNKTRESILQFIHQFFDDRGYAPTVRDILRGCGISSPAVVQYHLDVLQREGRIHRDPEVFRSIRLAGVKKLQTVPLIGTIAAGKPIPVPQSDAWIDPAFEAVELPYELSGEERVYALRVKGHSMVDALIDDGDIVLMVAAEAAANGDMVAVWLKDQREVTLKKIYFEPGRVVLKPANQAMQPLILHPDNIQVQGKVVGVIRKL